MQCIVINMPLWNTNLHKRHIYVNIYALLALNFKNMLMSNTFFNHVESLTRKDRKKFRKRIINICGIEEPTFYSWMRRRIVSEQSKKLISNYMQTTVETLFPETITV